MAYAISIGVVAAFVLLYFLTRCTIRPRYARYLDQDSFEKSAKQFVHSMPMPKKNGKMSGVNQIASIKRNLFLLKRKRYGGEFDGMSISKDKLKTLSCVSDLADLPFVGGDPRAVLLARFCIENSAGRADFQRIKCVLEAQNLWRTLTFKEIEGMKSAFKYALCEQFAFFYEKLHAFARCSDIAEKYVSSPLNVSKKYASLAKSKLFLSLCARAAGYKAEYYANLYDSCISNFKKELETLCASLEFLEKFDFTPFYSPLEIYDKYEIFYSAENGAKRNFLRLAGEISDRENLDEFLLAIRVDKYMHSASSGHMSLKRFTFAGRNFSCISQAKDISMLATALSSHYFMDMYFRPVNRRFSNRSITKILEYENSFEPIYKFKNLNFGINVKNGKLRISPTLPDEILSADVAFSYSGVEHSLHLKRGEKRAMYIGDTRVDGVGGLTLGENALNITLILPFKTASAKAPEKR